MSQHRPVAKQGKDFVTTESRPGTRGNDYRPDRLLYQDQSSGVNKGRAPRGNLEHT
jgi:hypothetical protein